MVTLSPLANGPEFRKKYSRMSDHLWDGRNQKQIDDQASWSLVLHKTRSEYDGSLSVVDCLDFVS